MGARRQREKRLIDPAQSPATDDWLERELRDDAREHADRYIADDGFTARVMTALPQPDTLPSWRKPALVALWAVAGAGIAFIAPAAVVDVARETFALVSAKRFALSEIAALLAVAGGAMWGSAYLAWRA